LNGELRLRLEAHEPADILNALDLAREFKLALTIDGGTGAHLVADDLARAGVPLAFAPIMESVAYTGGPGRYAAGNAPALLQGAGMRFCFGSGVLPTTVSSPQLAVRVARAEGNGYHVADAVTLVTSEAARFLGVEKDIGRLAPEMNADIVVWSDHPFAPGARVVRVFVGGRQVYRAEDLEREEGE
jgi:imidazolonepropionase-like amidohydrolase